MISYVIIAFVAILIGMAISVSAFGTGGKRKKIFQDIYFSIEDVDGLVCSIPRQASTQPF